MILRNGADEPDHLTAAIYMSLQRLLNTEPIAFVEIVCLARDPGYQIWGGVDGPIAKILKALALLSQDGKMHASTRNIVAASVEGEGLDMHLVSPRKAEG